MFFSAMTAMKRYVFNFAIRDKYRDSLSVVGALLITFH